MRLIPAEHNLLCEGHVHCNWVSWQHWSMRVWTRISQWNTAIFYRALMSFFCKLQWMAKHCIISILVIMTIEHLIYPLEQGYSYVRPLITHSCRTLTLHTRTFSLYFQTLASHIHTHVFSFLHWPVNFQLCRCASKLQTLTSHSCIF